MADTTDLFLSLTPEKVLEAVEAAGLRTNPVCYTLNSFENRVYEVELEDRSRVIPKFYRPGRWTAEQILEEHQFLHDAVAAEIPVCSVRKFPDGTTLKSIDNIFYCIYDRFGGRAPEELDDVMVGRLGMLAARLHNAGSTRLAENRVRLDADTYVRANLKYLEEHAVIPVAYAQRYYDAANAIANITDEYMRGVAVQRIHGDFHLGNLLQRDGVLYALDFDDMVIGPPVQDMWLALAGRDARALRQRQVFLEGYEQLRAFDRTTLRLIEPLRALRWVHYATWIARRWHDPAFPITWPHFGTDAYWAQETSDLEEQLGLIRRGDPEYAPPPPVEEELTNSDFFWDMDD
jgi:Ser/Thr protein kinase RdoA (MazF antagonist)